MTNSYHNPVFVPKGTELPPPAPGVRYVRMPFLGIVISDDDLRRRVDRFFHWPMIVLALAILPLLVLEIISRPVDVDLDVEPDAIAAQVENVKPAEAPPPPGSFQAFARSPAMRNTVATGFAVIWLAFLIEFLIKISIAESRTEYVRRNWLDVVIILVPVLRPIRAASVARTTRVFRLRGVAMKCARYLFTFIIGLEATDRLLHRVGLKVRSDLKRPETMTRNELMNEVKRLRSSTQRWDAWHTAHERFVAEKGGPCYVGPDPRRETDRSGDEPEREERSTPIPRVLPEPPPS